MQFIRIVFLLIISLGFSCGVKADNNDWLLDYTIQELNKVYEHNAYLERNGICQGQIYHVDMNYMIYGKYTMGADHTRMVAELDKANVVSTPPKPNLYVLFTAFYNQFLATNGTQEEITSFENSFKSAVQAKAKLLHSNNSGILFWAASELNNLVLPNATAARPIGNVNNKSGILLGYGLSNEDIYNRLVALKPYFYPSSQQTFPVWALNTVTNIGRAIQDNSFSAGDVVIAGAASRPYQSSELVWESRMRNNSNVQAGDTKIWDEAGIMTAAEEQDLVRRLTAANKKFKIYTSSSNYTTDIRNLNLQSQSTQGTFEGLEKNAIQRLYEYTGMQDGEIALALHFHSGNSINLLYWDVRIGTQLVDEQTKAFIKNTFIESLFNQALTAKINDVLYASFTSNNNILLDVPAKVAKIRGYLDGSLLDDEETQIINILSETANKDIPALMVELERNDYALLYDIIDGNILGGMQDAIMGIWGENNYGKLMQCLSSLITRDPVSVAAITSLNAEELAERTIVWHNTRLFSGEFVGKHAYEVSQTSDNDIQYTQRLTTKYYNYTVTGQMGQTYSMMVPNYKDFSPVTLNPLALVVFEDYSNLSLVSDALPTNSTIKLVPAIFLKYADDKTFNEDVVTALGLIGDVVTLAYGPGLITKSVGVMRYFYAFEMIAAGINVGIVYSDIGSDPKYTNLVNLYNGTMGLVGLGTLAANLPGTVQSVGAIASNWKSLVKNFIAETMHLESELDVLKLTKPKVNGVLELKESLYAEWKLKYPNEPIDENTWKAFSAVSNVSGVGTVNSLKKLIGKASSENILWRNLDDANIIWANPGNNVLSTAKSFANEMGSSLYDVVLNNGFYVKVDINDGRILLGNTNGDFHAFAVINDANLSGFKSSVLNVSDEVFNTKLSQLLSTSADKLKILSGVVSKQLTIAGKTVTLNSSKVNTMLGRFRPDIANLFDELNSFKNVGLGETKGGINILNKPDYYYDPSSWWNAYNRPWLDKAITRGDDIYLATIPTKADDIIKNGQLLGAYAEELNHIAMKNYKPVNITVAEWDNIKNWLGY